MISRHYFKLYDRLKVIDAKRSLVCSLIAVKLEFAIASGVIKVYLTEGSFSSIFNFSP